MSDIDFYLASSEGYDLDEPRACRAIARLHGERRDDYLLVNICPPLVGQGYGLGENDLDQVVIAPRFQEESLMPIKRWPVFVHVARLVVPYVGQDAVHSDDLELIAWAEVYESEEAAREKRMQG